MYSRGKRLLYSNTFRRLSLAVFTIKRDIWTSFLIFLY